MLPPGEYWSLFIRLRSGLNKCYIRKIIVIYIGVAYIITWHSGCQRWGRRDELLLWFLSWEWIFGLFILNLLCSWYTIIMNCTLMFLFWLVISSSLKSSFLDSITQNLNFWITATVVQLTIICTFFNFNSLLSFASPFPARLLNKWMQTHLVICT